MRKISYIIAVLVCVIGLTFFIWIGKGENARNSSLRSIQIAGINVKATVAGTSETRARGLGGREELAENEGMLFVFDSDASWGFWMKDMRFAIDILWISSDGKILDMRESVSPATYPSVFTPRAPARYVLELPAGFGKSHDVKIGDAVRF